MTHRLCEVLLALVSLVAWTKAEPRDYCQSSIFNASCPLNHVVLMSTAFYGRMKTGSCVSGSYGEIGCKEDVLDYMDRKCSGMRRCSVYIAESELHTRTRCPRDLAVYLEADYSCVEVATASQTECSSKGKITVAGPQGYLTRQEAIDNNLGTPLCPWLIKVNTGQKITITYYNFGGGKVDGPSGSVKAPSFSLHSQGTCYEVGTIWETQDRERTITTCGADSSDREGIIYKSSTNVVNVRFMRREVLRTLAPFVLRYEATGCPNNLPPPRHGYVTYTDDVAAIRCNKSDETWFLTCTKGQWQGTRGNCSQKTEDPAWTFRQTLTEGTDGFPYGILIVVSIGVALGVFIGGLVLSLVYFYMKRKRNPYQEPPQTMSQQDYYQGTATLKKNTPHSPNILVTRDLCPPMTFEDHEHVCTGIPHVHDGYYSTKQKNFPVQRVYDACASSAQRSGHVYETTQVT